MKKLFAAIALAIMALTMPVYAQYDTDTQRPLTVLRRDLTAGYIDVTSGTNIRLADMDTVGEAAGELSYQFKIGDVSILEIFGDYDGAGGFDATRISIAGNLIRSVTAGITASNPGNQGDSPLTSDINEVSTVGAGSDAVTLPTAVAGLEIFIINNGANVLEIFPASSDNLGAGVNSATTLAAGANVTFVAYDVTNWETK